MNQITKDALISRVFILSLGSISNFLVGDLDESNDLFWEKSTLKSLVSPFVKWDGIHFLRIAEFGYESDKMHAFFPLFPLVINVGGRILHFFTFGLLDLRCAMALFG